MGTLLIAPHHVRRVHAAACVQGWSGDDPASRARRSEAAVGSPRSGRRVGRRARRHRYWGRFGAAGLLALDPELGVLLQHRVSWSHFGDTWALPGGARHEGESATGGALRESAEEAGVPDAAIRPRLLSVFDLGYWSYTTLVGDVVTPFEPQITDPESRELAWVPPSEVTALPLHPGFASSWAALEPLLGIRPAIVVDVANVVGSVPDGWWRDRAGAAGRLLSRIAALADGGLPGDALGLPEHTWFPEWAAVVEGQARRRRSAGRPRSGPGRGVR